eukprot:SAG31_NODE_599_length_13649_cov_9.930775_5_plen_96_part_00
MAHLVHRRDPCACTDKCKGVFALEWVLSLDAENQNQNQNQNHNHNHVNIQVQRAVQRETLRLRSGAAHSLERNMLELDCCANVKTMQPLGRLWKK